MGGDYQTEKQKESEQSNSRKAEQVEEVTKLRKLLSAATEELSRQLSSLTQKQGQDDRLLSRKSIAFHVLRVV